MTLKRNRHYGGISAPADNSGPIPQPSRPPEPKEDEWLSLPRRHKCWMCPECWSAMPCERHP